MCEDRMSLEHAVVVRQGSVSPSIVIDLTFAVAL
jgi:hypothetical protein